MQIMMDKDQMRFMMFSIALAMLVMIAYYPGLSGPFVSDDINYVINNAVITDTPISQFWTLFTNLEVKEYLPIRDLSYLIEYQLYGDNPWGYKLNNLLIYLLLLLVLYELTLSLLRLYMPDYSPVQSRYLSLAVTALYALHPLHVESVTWISGRKDLLSTLFALLALLQFCQVLMRSEKSFVAWLKPLLATAVFLLLAMLSKAAISPVALLMGLLALAFFVERLTFFQAVARSVVVSLPLLIIVLLMTWFHSSIGGQSGIGITDAEIPPKILSDLSNRVPHILGALTQIAIWPTDLRLIYDVYQGGGVFYVRLFLAFAIVIAALWGAWKFIAHRSLIGLGLFVFLLLNLPYLQIVPFQTWSLASERFLVISSYGLILSLVVFLYQFKSRALVVALLVLLPFYTFATWQRSVDWQSRDSIYIDNYNKSPQFLYSAYLKIKMIDLRDHDYPAALQAARGVVSPLYRDVLISMVEFYQAIDQVKQRGGVSALQQAAQAMSKMHRHLDESKYHLQNYGDANYYRAMGFFLRQVYLTFLEYDPDNAHLYYNLGLLYMNVNPRFASMGAVEYFSRAIELGGLDRATETRAWNHLGTTYLMMKEFDKARRAFSNGDKLNVNDYRAAYNLLLLDVMSGQTQSLPRSTGYFRVRARQSGLSDVEIQSLIDQALNQ